jgi:uncharacterized phage protein (TIGR01671 family)
MREIKFRAWDKQDKCWFDRFEWNSIEGWCIITPPSIGFIPLTDKIEVMQYTGLKDKNGKEIYEGDIVKINCPTDIGLYLIVWEDGVFRYKYENRVFYSVGEMMVKWTEVIGNIYDNPELLGG